MALLYDGISSAEIDGRIKFYKKEIESNLVAIRDIENLSKFAKFRFDIDIENKSILEYKAKNKRYETIIITLEREIIERMWRNID